MSTRTWKFTLNTGSRPFMTPWQHPGVKAEILEHIEATGGSREWVSDPAMLTRGVPRDQLQGMDQLCFFLLDPATQRYEPKTGNPYGWQTELEGGALGGNGTQVYISVSDFNGRHLLLCTVDQPSRKSLSLAIAHLSAAQERDIHGSLTLDQLQSLVAQPAPASTVASRPS